MIAYIFQLILHKINLNVSLCKTRRERSVFTPGFNEYTVYQLEGLK